MKTTMPNSIIINILKNAASMKMRGVTRQVLDALLYIMLTEGEINTKKIAGLTGIKRQNISRAFRELLTIKSVSPVIQKCITRDTKKASLKMPIFHKLNKDNDLQKTVCITRDTKKDEPMGVERPQPRKSACIIQDISNEKCALYSGISKKDKQMTFGMSLPLSLGSNNLKVIKKKKKKRLGERKKNEQGFFVSIFSRFYRLKTGEKYNALARDFVTASRLIKAHGFPAVKNKTKILASHCAKPGSAWFVSGWCDFTIGKLSHNWNNLLFTQSAADKEREKWEKHERLVRNLLGGKNGNDK